MKTIWKFPLPSIGTHTIAIPQGAEFLSFQIQAGIPTVWARVDPEAPESRAYVSIVGTGHRAPYGGRFLGTVQTGPFVWHAFVTQ